jgi:L-lactate dehydrogenase complex protein LldF
MRYWRSREYAEGLAPKATVAGLGVWAYFAKRPRVYGLAAGVAARILKLLSRSGRVHALPVMRNWFAIRDFPAPRGKTFSELWAARK